MLVDTCLYGAYFYVGTGWVLPDADVGTYGPPRSKDGRPKFLTDLHTEGCVHIWPEYITFFEIRILMNAEQ
jgi:hypothetical protein